MGKVILMGAGPGDPGLLTEKGIRALKEAEVVLYDRLVSLGVLAYIPSTALCIDVGKKPNHHPVPQEEINQLILDYAKQGKTVVRLKGGDPYLFGRGAEELELIGEAGIPFQVIPGVTSAVSVPAYGGIPVTHRDFSSSVHIITAHGREHTQPHIDFDRLVGLGGTLVFMMGVREIPNLSEGLIKAGMPPEMPAALVYRGSTSRQRTLVSTIGEIPLRAKEEGFQPPSVFVVGKVAELSQRFNWFEKQPLAGTSVLVMQPPTTASKLGSGLEQQGCTVVRIPAIERTSLPLRKEVVEKLPEMDWLIFTSPQGVKEFFKHLYQEKIDFRQFGKGKIAAVGPSTEKELNLRGVQVDCVPETFDGDHLVAALAERIKKEDQVFLYRSSIGRKEISRRLSQLSDHVWDVPAYDTTIEAELSPYLGTRLEAGEVDYVAFTSASTVEGFVALAGKIDLTKIHGICIGEQTKQAAESYGIKVTVSPQATIDSMVETILQLERETL